MLPLSKIIAIVAIAVALGVAAVGAHAHYRIVETNARSSEIIIDVLADEQRSRWRRQSALLAADLSAQLAQRAPDSDAPDADAQGRYRQTLRRALRQSHELASARLLDRAGAVIASVASVGSEPAAGAAGNGPASAPPSTAGPALLAAWRERADAEQARAEIPIAAESRLYVVIALGGDPRGEGASHYLASAYSTAPLAAMAADLERHRQSESRSSLVLLILIGVGVELLAIILLFLYARRLEPAPTAAPADVSSAPEADADLIAARHTVRTGAALHDMAGELAVLLQETAEKSRMDKDLEIVQTVQTTLLPPAELVERGGLSFAGKLHTAGICGGDWWTYRDLADGKLLLAIGDVTGHGASAAMITAAAKAACDLACDLHENRPTVTEVLQLMNQAVFHAGGRRLLMTCFAMIIDPVSGAFEFANAGHNFPWLARPGAGQPALSSLVARGNRLGDLPQSEFTSGRNTLQPGDCVLLYTDGVIECENHHGTQFGGRRMREVVVETLGAPALAQRDALIDSALKFSRGPLEDDLTLVCVRFARPGA